MKKIIFIIMFINCISQLYSQIYEFDPYETKPTGTPIQIQQKSYDKFMWRMTLENELTASAIWNKITPTNLNPNINLNEDFCIRFSTQFSKNSDDDAGADGITFILKNPSSNYWVGNDGAGIGYVTIQHSLAIEFDTYWNDSEDTFSFDHIQYVYTNIARTKIGNEVQIIPGLEDNVETGKWYEIRIEWDASTRTMATYVKDVLRQSRTLTPLQKADICDANGWARWGFTSATGDHNNEQTIQLKGLLVGNCCNVELQVAKVGGVEKYYDSKDFVGSLIVCANTSVELNAVNLDLDLDYIEWYVNGTLLSPQPTDELIYSFTPAETTEVSIKAYYESGCIAEDRLIIIPINLTVTLPEKSEFCQQEPVTLTPTVAINGVTIPNIELASGGDYYYDPLSTTQTAWIEWAWTETVVPSTPPIQLYTGTLDKYNLNLDLVGKNFEYADYTLTATYHEYYNSSRDPNFLVECTVPTATTVVLKKAIAEIKILKDLCKDGCDGKLQADVYDLSGIIIPEDGFIESYDWDGPTGVDIDDFGASGPSVKAPDIKKEGIYKVTITLTNGCIAYAEIEVLFKDFKILEVKGNDLCSEGAAQKWEVLHTDCNPDYNYEWTCISAPDNVLTGAFPSSPSTTTIQTIDNFVYIQKPGTFTVTVTNQYDCEITEQFVVKQKDFSCELVVRELCVDGNDAKIEVLPIGGKAPFQYGWTRYNGTSYVPYYPTVISQYIVQLPIGEYVLTITDDDGCTSTRTVNIIEPNFEAHDYYGVCEGESVQLRTYKGIDPNEETSLYNGEHIVWTPSDGLDQSIDKLEPIATPDRDITYTGTFTKVYRTGNSLTVGCKEVTCSVFVKKSEKDFIRGISDTTSSWYYPEFEFDGLAKTERITYNNSIQEENFDCGYLIFGRYKDNQCISNSNVLITKLNNNMNLLWENLYYKSGETDEYPYIIFSNINTMYEIPTDFHNKISKNQFHFIVGSYNYSLDNNQNILLMKISTANGSIIKSNTLTLTNASGIAIKAIQSKDLQYIYIIGWYNSIEHIIQSPLNCYDILLMKINTNSLRADWVKNYYTSDQDVPYDLVEKNDNNIMIVGETNHFGSPKVKRTLILDIDNETGNPLNIKTYQNPDFTNKANFSNKIINTGADYLILGNTNCYDPGTYINPHIFRIDENLNVINSSGFRITKTPNDRDITLYETSFTPTKQLNLAVKNIQHAITFLNINPSSESINNQVYFQNQSSENCYEPNTKILPNLLNQNFEGLASLSFIDCHDINNLSTYNDSAIIIKFNTYNNLNRISSTCLTSENLYVDKNYNMSISDSTMLTASCDTVSHFGGYSLLNRNIIESDSICGATVCHCDDSRINVVITPIEDTEDEKCNYAISFHTQANYSGTCNIKQVEIIGNGFSQVFDFGVVIGVNYTSSTFTLSLIQFSGIQTLTINYLDATGNIVCSTTKDIVCACVCQDFIQNLNFDFEPASGYPSPTECCYDLYINNENNDCNFRDAGIIIEYPSTISSSQISFATDISNGWSVNTTPPANSIQLDRDNNQIVGGARVKLGTICVERNNEIKTISIKVNNENCYKEWTKDLGCSKSCCEYIDNVTFTATTSEDPFFCCYTLSYDIIGDISECSDYITLQIKYKGKVLKEITMINGYPDGSFTEGHHSFVVCIPTYALYGLPQSIDLSLDFLSDNGENISVICSKELGTITNCITCCDKIHFTGYANPTYDDGTQCCFRFNTQIDNGIGCGGVHKIKIVDEYNNLIWESSATDEFNTGGVNNYRTYCVDKSKFNGQNSLKIKIKYYNDLDQEICNDDFEIFACDDFPEPCTPDYLNDPWSSPITEYMTFNCNNNPNSPVCRISYTYRYRHIKSGSTSIYRDIQILSYSFNPECTCQEYIIASLLWKIISNPYLKNAFDITTDPSFLNNSTKCYNNYRLITSDCWQTESSGLVRLRPCNQSICCYAVYLVCYTKDLQGTITTTSFNKTNNYYVPSSCPSTPYIFYPCTPNNCTSFGPQTQSSSRYDELNGPLGPPKMGINLFDVNNQKDDELTIIQNDLNSSFDITVTNTMKGEVNIQFYSLLGNLIYSADYTKEADSFNTIINVDLHSGIYYCTVKLKDKVIGSKKIIIVK